MSRKTAYLLATMLTLSACAVLDQEQTPDGSAVTGAPERPARSGHPALRTNTGPSNAAEQQAEPEAPDDLWDRIRAGFAYADVRHERIDAATAMYARSHGYLETISAGAEPYLHYIVEQVEARDMPLEIALIPAVESGFQPDAQSAMQASGIWQFMPATAESRGLRTNWWYDGRKDVVASTEAALDYLEMLHGMFDDWFLAFAAYNAGQGTVQRAIRENAGAGRPTDYWSLNLPAETQRYVPRILAVAELIRDPEQYQLTLKPLPNEPVLAMVETGGQIDLNLAAELAGVDAATLRVLNPGLNQSATDPNGPHQLAVPADKADIFVTQLDSVATGDRVAFQQYEVRSGDSLGAIASRYGTTVAAIRSANSLNGDVIRVGQQLKVPAGAGSAPVAEAGGETAYTVRSGDSLSAIASRFGVSMAELRAWNDLDQDSTLHPGQTLTMRSNNGRSARR